MKFKTSIVGNKILLADLNGIRNESLEEIVFFRASNRYSEVCLINNCSYNSKVSLKELEGKLAEKYFMRIHRAFIVNLIYVYKIEIGRDRVILKNKMVLPLSRRKRNGLIEGLMKITVSLPVGKS